MATVPPVVLRHMRTLLASQVTQPLSDRELLHRFAAHRDEAAFTELVQRHGAMVRRVGQRWLHHSHDVDDVFQATFLVLAVKAPSVAWRPSAAGWLHEVAYRLAQKTKGASSRRRRDETCQVNRPTPDPLAEITLREAQAVLDGELQQLAERYRSPLVLCYLEDKTQDEAAKQLGWSLSTLKRRLEQGRALLRARLVRRGLTLAAVLSSTLWTSGVEGAVAPGLVAGTLQATLAFVADRTTTAVSAQAAALAEGVLGAMNAKVKLVTAMLVAVHLLVAGAGVFALHALAAPAADPDEPKPAQKEDKPQGAIALKERATLKAHNDQVWAVAVSPDGKTAASVSGMWKNPGQLVIWDLTTGKVRNHVKNEDEAAIRAVAFTRDGKTLMTGDVRGNLKLRDPDTGAERAAWQALGCAINHVAFSPDGAIVAAVGGVFGQPKSGEAKLWDTATKKELHTLGGHALPVLTVAFSPDGRTLATGSSDGNARLWDVTSGKERMTLAGHTKDVEYVAFSPDGRTVVTGSWDSTVKLWEVATGQERATLKKHTWEVLSLAVVADGRTVISVGGERDPESKQPGEIKVWDMIAQKELLGQQAHALKIWCVAVSADGKTVVTASRDETVKVWDLVLPKEKAAVVELGAKEQEALWDDLAGVDAAKAYKAIWRMATAPQTVPFLQKQLKPAAPADAEQKKRIAKLLADLDSDVFAERQKATDNLEKEGPAAEPLLRKVLEGAPSPEVRLRVERVLIKLLGPVATPEARQALRAVEVLENIGSPEAKEILTKLTQGAPQARLTLEAAESVKRMGNRR